MRTAWKANATTPALDLDVLREVLLYAISDTSREPNLAAVDLALRRAIEEIDAIVPSGQATAKQSARFGRFIPRALKASVPTASREPGLTATKDGGDAPAVQPVSNRRKRTGYGDRDFLQQSITDYFRRPST